MGSHECPKVLPCLATGREGRGTWDQVIFVLGCFWGFFFVVVLFAWFSWGVFFGFAFLFLFCLFCFVGGLFSFILVLVFVWVLFGFLMQGCGEGKPNNKKPLTFLQPAYPQGDKAVAAGVDQLI